MDIRELFERQSRRIYRLAMMYLKNPADAEDAVQNVFLKYMERQITFQDMNHETAWFITVTRNHCKDQLKNFWRRNVEIGKLPEGLHKEEPEQKLLEHLMKLPAKYREVLYFYYYEDYTVREMSQMFERKESTIQTQLADARKKLKVILEKEGS